MNRINYQKPLICPECGEHQQVSLPIWVTPGEEDVDVGDIDYDADPDYFFCPNCECRRMGTQDNSE